MRRERDGDAYQVEVVLDQIVLERLERERAVGHLLHERVVCVLVPEALDVGALEEVVEEVAAMPSISLEVSGCVSASRGSLRREWQLVRRVEVVDRSITLA